jgi:hypothetical protein
MPQSTSFAERHRMTIRQVIPKKHFDPGDTTSLRILSDATSAIHDARDAAVQMSIAGDVAKNYRRDAHVSFSGIMAQGKVATPSAHSFQSIDTLRPPQSAAISMPHTHRIKNHNTGARNSRPFLVLAAVLVIVAIAAYVFG